MSHIFLVRHGETAWNKQKRYQGKSDVPLSLVGTTQVKALAAQMKHLKLGVVYSSTLERAGQTARLIAPHRKVHADARINEMDFGDWEGRRATELFAARDAAYQRFANGQWVKPPGGESIQQVEKRVGAFWKDVLTRHPNKNITIVSHVVPIKTLMLKALGWPRAHMFQLQLNTASLIVLRRYENSFFQLTAFNDVPDL